VWAVWLRRVNINIVLQIWGKWHKVLFSVTVLTDRRGKREKEIKPSEQIKFAKVFERKLTLQLSPTDHEAVPFLEIEQHSSFVLEKEKG